MSIRPTLTTTFLNAMSGGHVSWFWLVKMELTSGNLFLTSLDFDVVISGDTYTGMRGLGNISQIEESDNGATGISLSLAGVTESHIAEVLNENIQGRKVTVKMGVLNTSTEPPLLAIDDNVWQGFLDTQNYNEGQSTIIVTAENRLIEWDKPRLLRFSNQDLKRVRPDDNFFKYADTMANKEIIVFSKAQVKATMKY
jgi:hypothetical protein